MQPNIYEIQFVSILVLLSFSFSCSINNLKWVNFLRKIRAIENVPFSQRYLIFRLELPFFFLQGLGNITCSSLYNQVNLYEVYPNFSFRSANNLLSCTVIYFLPFINMNFPIDFISLNLIINRENTQFWSYCSISHFISVSASSCRSHEFHLYWLSTLSFFCCCPWFGTAYESTCKISFLFLF